MTGLPVETDLYPIPMQDTCSTNFGLGDFSREACLVLKEWKRSLTDLPKDSSLPTDQAGGWGKNYSKQRGTE